MADPIVVFDRIDRRRDPRQPVLAVYRALFLYAISPPVVNALGEICAPTPSAGLSPDAATVLAASELSGLDSGALAYSVEEFSLLPGQPLVGLVTQAQALYSGRKDEVIAQARSRFLRIGFRVAVSGESV